jgi:hypothetical protein
MGRAIVTVLIRDFDFDRPNDSLDEVFLLGDAGGRLPMKLDYCP